MRMTCRILRKAGKTSPDVVGSIALRFAMENSLFPTLGQSAWALTLDFRRVLAQMPSGLSIAWLATISLAGVYKIVDADQSRDFVETNPPSAAFFRLTATVRQRDRTTKQKSQQALTCWLRYFLALRPGLEPVTYGVLPANLHELIGFTR